MILAILRKFRKNDEGAIAVETALIMTILLTIALGVLDFGLLMSRKMEVTNAVRAGVQYALVRKPIIDPLNTGTDAYAAIKAATLEGLIDNGRASYPPDITASLACSCGSAVSACFGSDPDPNSENPEGEDVTCADGVLRSVHLTITLQETYSFIFGFVGTAQSIIIYDDATVRL